MFRRKFLIYSLFSVFLLGFPGCATVPKEAVQLTYTLGEDLQQLHVGYRNTAKFSFEQIQKRGPYAIENTWTPAFLKEFIVTGKLSWAP